MEAFGRRERTMRRRTQTSDSAEMVGTQAGGGPSMTDTYTSQVDEPADLALVEDPRNTRPLDNGLQDDKLRETRRSRTYRQCRLCMSFSVLTQ